jgi:hypothetical protein
MSPENLRPTKHQQTIDELVEYIKTGEISEETYLYFAKHNPKRFIAEISNGGLLNLSKKGSEDEVIRWQNLCIIANRCAGNTGSTDTESQRLARALDPSMASEEIHRSE